MKNISVFVVLLVLLMCSFAYAELPISIDALFAFNGSYEDVTGNFSLDTQSGATLNETDEVTNMPYVLELASNGYAKTTSALDHTLIKSIATWFYRPSSMHGTTSRLWVWGKDGNNLIRLNLNSKNQLYFNSWHSGSEKFTVTSDIVANDTWHLAIVTWDSSSAEIFLDGNSVANAVDGAVTLPSFTPTCMGVGTHYDCSTATSGGHRQGAIAFSNTKMTGANMTKLWNGADAYLWGLFDAGTVLDLNVTSPINFSSDGGQLCGYNWSSLTYTSCGSSTDRTPTFSFSTSGDADCRLDVQQRNYSLSNSSQDCATSGTTNHVCTYPTNLSAGSTNLYVTCDASGAQMGSGDWSTHKANTFTYLVSSPSSGSPTQTNYSDVTGVLTADTCPDDTTQEILFIAFVFVMLIVVLVVNHLIILLPALDVAIGVAFVFFAMLIFKCSAPLALPMIMFALVLVTSAFHWKK